MIRKVFARDVKPGQTVNTVFRVTDKERHTAKSGKVFLSMTLFDKTGRLDGRIFDNVDAAEAAFQNDDYLLVSGKVSLFHGKAQLMVERIEKLDPGPIEASEFTPPPRESVTRSERPERGDRAEKPGKAARQRLLNLLDDPAVAQGLEALLKHLERYVDDRVDQRLAGGGGETRRTPRTERPDRTERPERSDKSDSAPKKAEPHKSGLPKDLAFKPFNALAPTEPSDSAQAESPPAENSPPTPSGS